MLHAIRITEERVERQYIAVCWNGHDTIGNARLREQTRNISPAAHERPAEEGPAASGCAYVSMRRSVVWWKQGTTTGAG